MTGKGKKTAAPRKKANGYKMPAPIPTGEVIIDTIGKKKWRIGPSIGVGGFGEIYSACEHENSPKKGSGYPFVVKIEPHENGPLFVEKNFYCRNTSKDEITKFMKTNKLSSLGMPSHYGNGTHVHNGEKYRYLVLERYGKDVWSIFKDCGRSFPPPTVFQLGLQMLDVLEYIHSKGYVHADIKGANVLMGLKKGTENQAYLVDYGLATRITDKEFKPDPKCAHNGTIEYTSRDAHLGVPTMRGDLEILAYNMLQWIVGELPWEKALKQPKTVQDLKENFMKNVRNNISKQYSNVPDALIKFFEYINSLKPKDIPDYTKCRQIFETYLKTEAKTRTSKLEFTGSKAKKTKTSNNASIDDEVDGPIKKVTKRGRKLNDLTDSIETENGENEKPDLNSDIKIKKKVVKRKSSELQTLVNVKKTKLTPKATPPAKKNHISIATQTSIERTRKSPRQVSFNSPICEIIGEKKPSRIDNSVNSSGDIFEDSFVIEDKKIKPKRKLLSNEKVVTKVVKKKITTSRAKPKSWKDTPAVLNGRSPPK